MTESPPPEYSELPPVLDRQSPIVNHLDLYQGPSSNQAAGSSHESSHSISSSTSPFYEDRPLSPLAAARQPEKSQTIVLRPDSASIRPDSVFLRPDSVLVRPAESDVLSSDASDARPPTIPRSPSQEYHTPKTYRIGKQTVPQSLVPIEEIKGHLALLRSFVELKKSVKSAVVQVPHVPKEQERKWSWFVGLAVERFDVWCQALKKEDATKAAQVVLPPVDVLMVWHSYMLNPRWYAEDCIRISACQTLSKFERHFRNFLKDPWKLEDPLEGCVDFWVSKTGLGYDPLVEMNNMTEKRITCPKCNEAIRVDLVNKEGTGYFQSNFKAMCGNKKCTISYAIKKEHLAVRKLVQDLTTEMTLHDTRASSYLAGTFLTQSSADKKKGLSIKQGLLERAEAFSQTLAWARNLDRTLEPHLLYLVVLEQCSCSMKALKRLMGLSNHSPRLVNRIMNAYNHDKAYSVELVGAVLRQGSFVEKMKTLGWTSPGFFDKPIDELVLEHAMARYHAFLDLMLSSETSFIVPTLDIDLVWHTHQLSPEKYQADCNRYLRRFVDHDDKVEGSKLSTAFEDTCRAWKERYHIQYIHCGCPIEGNSIGERLSRIVGRGQSSKASSALTPFDRHDLLSSTHPSDHNAVRLKPKNDAVCRAEKAIIESFEVKRQKEMDKATRRASKTGKSLLLSMTSSKSGDDDGASPSGGKDAPLATRCWHDAAFLVPVPMFFGNAALNGGGCVPEGQVVSIFGALPGVHGSNPSGIMARGVCGTTPLFPDGSECGC